MVNNFRRLPFAAATLSDQRPPSTAVTLSCIRDPCFLLLLLCFRGGEAIVKRQRKRERARENEREKERKRVCVTQATHARDHSNHFDLKKKDR